jgi:hypothetical protein
MPTISKADLYAGVTASANITSNQDFELRNNAGNIYFSIEGQNDTALFNTAKFTSLVNCKVVSGSKNAGFAVTGPATASFTLNIGGTNIAKENIKFRATNTLSSSPGLSGNTTSSYFGIDLTYS